ncbi:hypothetical protein FRB96_001451 [Tulasnella sp. 330]|nr:hypothetical protein FRB96_001451 [Tulasnella sp. 330]KAG8869655.1 hypothetical protein FRB98_002289 [Tulasnella sp. 332]KAG8884369.1 hypothetical protein FRB97_004378 [Tulasnella sp. 331]
MNPHVGESGQQHNKEVEKWFTEMVLEKRVWCLLVVGSPGGRPILPAALATIVTIQGRQHLVDAVGGRLGCNSE